MEEGHGVGRVPIVSRKRTPKAGLQLPPAHPLQRDAAVFHSRERAGRRPSRWPSRWVRPPTQALPQRPGARPSPGLFRSQLLQSQRVEGAPGPGALGGVLQSPRVVGMGVGEEDPLQLAQSDPPAELPQRLRSSLTAGIHQQIPARGGEEGNSRPGGAQ